MRQLTFFGASEDQQLPLEIRIRQLKIIDVGKEILGDLVQNLPKGPNHWGRCPFHQEKIPSFYLKLKDNFYICYGCNSRGGPLALPFTATEAGFLPEQFSPFSYLAEKVQLDFWKQEELEILKNELIRESQRVKHEYGFLRRFFN